MVCVYGKRGEEVRSSEEIKDGVEEAGRVRRGKEWLTETGANIEEAKAMWRAQRIWEKGIPARGSWREVGWGVHGITNYKASDVLPLAGRRREASKEWRLPRWAKVCCSVPRSRRDPRRRQTGRGPCSLPSLRFSPLPLPYCHVPTTFFSLSSSLLLSLRLTRLLLFLLSLFSPLFHYSHILFLLRYAPQRWGR